MMESNLTKFVWGGSMAFRGTLLDKEDRLIISQTKIRELLKTNQAIPQEILRPEIADILSKGDVLNEGN